MTKTRKSATKIYNPTEVEAMRKAGYVTPRAAAEEAGTSLDLVYRAIRKRTVGGKEVQDVRVKVGDNCWNRYVHRKEWLALVEAKRAKAYASA